MNNNVRNDHQSPSRGRVFVVVFLMLCGLTAMSFWISHSPLMDDLRTGWAAMIAVSLAKSRWSLLFSCTSGGSVPGNTC